MQEDAFQAYMANRNLAEKTRNQRLYALRRIERAQNVNLDEEFERDKLTKLFKQLAYSAADARASLPNPSNIEIDPDRLVPHLSWYRSHLSDYLRFRSGASEDYERQTELTSTPSPTDDLVEEVLGKTFELEKDLQAALRKNIAQLELGLTIIDGGNERRVEAGFIDILARDAAGVLTVIELKAETARPEAIAQILAYMGCLAQETGEAAIRGVLIAADHHPRVTFAARAIPNLMLKKYSYKFQFE